MERHSSGNAPFDCRKLQAELEGAEDPRDTCRKLLERGRRRLDDRFASGAAISRVVHGYAWLVDRIVVHAWRKYTVAMDGAELVATGGYGRGELHPYSDIDLLILHRTRPPKELLAAIGDFLAFLWDIGLQPGHGVRTVRQCRQLASTDVTVLTSLMETRSLDGSDGPLLHALLHAIAPRRTWAPRRYFEAKCREQAERYARYHRTAHKLEPNVKEGPGGLRDVQTVAWVARRHYGVRHPSELRRHGFSGTRELRALEDGRELLWRIRYALHALAGRREERLLFGYQRQIAKRFGYNGTGNAPVEQFMKLYYRTCGQIEVANEILLQHFRELYTPVRGKRSPGRPVGQRFRIVKGYLEANEAKTFQRYPYALVELFMLLQQRPSLRGIRAATLCSMRARVARLKPNFRDDLRVKSLFMEVFRQAHGVASALRRMHRYGVLGAVLPAFARVEGMMQFDLFHVYTVDEHTLRVLEKVDEFAAGPDPRYPLCHELIQQIPKRELLYLAALCHDVAKGRGGDHSQQGAEEAHALCKHLLLSDYDANLVAWLVKRHLALSRTAGREDLDDPETVERFAGLVGSVDRLNYLYLLTVADINGTNPDLWNGWKDHLLGDLYSRTLRTLRRGLGRSPARAERARETYAQALALLRAQPETVRRIEPLWKQFGEDYFVRYRPDEIAWHAPAIVGNKRKLSPLILVNPRTSRGCTEVFLYMSDRDHVFAVSAYALDRLGLSVVDARIVTTDNGYVLDSYSVLDRNGACLHGRSQEVRQALRRALRHVDPEPLPVLRRTDSRIDHFEVPVRVDILDDPINDRTILEVSARDRPGFLYRVGAALSQCGVRVQGARIATYGERVEDVFFVTDRQRHKLTDPLQIECLQQTIARTLHTQSPEVAHAPPATAVQ